MFIFQSQTKNGILSEHTYRYTIYCQTLNAHFLCLVGGFFWESCFGAALLLDSVFIFGEVFFSSTFVWDFLLDFGFIIISCQSVDVGSNLAAPVGTSLPEDFLFSQDFMGSNFPALYPELALLLECLNFLEHTRPGRWGWVS